MNPPVGWNLPGAAPGAAPALAEIIGLPPAANLPAVEVQGNVAQVPDLNGPQENVRLGAGAPQALTAPRTLTFAQYYSDPSKDPYHRSYQRIMTRFDPSQPAALPSDMLYQQVVNIGSTVPQAYLFCAATLAGPRIYCIHLISRYVGALDGDTTPWDNQSFGCLGEVVHGVVSTIGFPASAFEEVSAWVKRPNLMLQNLQALDNAPVFAPNLPDQDDEELEEVTSRRYMFLPHAYIPLFLNASGYTIKQVWETLYPAMVQRQELLTCIPLLRWLQITSTGTTLANPLQMGPPATASRLYSPPADAALLHHRQNILYQALPQLNAPPVSLETALNQMAAALIVQTNDARATREQKQAHDMEPKLPSSRFTVTLPVLLEYLQLDNELHLPTIWHSWANCTKRQETQVLRDTLDTFSRSADAFSTSVPLVTARLVQDILSFQFVGQSADDIKTGLHPFIIMDGTAEQRQVNTEVARLYGLLTTGDATCSLADLEALSAKEIRSVPLTYWELDKCLGMFGNLIAVLLGNNHALVVSFRELWQLLQTNVKDEVHSILEYRKSIKPTHILRSVQLTFFTWFAHKRAKLTPPDPALKNIIHQIVMQVYVTPTLPPVLYQLAYPKKPTVFPLVPDLISASGSSSNAGSQSGTISSGSSTMSGLTTPTIPTTPTPATRGAVVVNLTPNVALQTLLPATYRIRELIGNSKPPEFDAGGEMCLAYLTRNTCWSNCKRASQHRANLTPSEHTRLEQYIAAQKAAYDARRPQNSARSAAGSSAPSRG